MLNVTAVMWSPDKYKIRQFMAEDLFGWPKSRKLRVLLPHLAKQEIPVALILILLPVCCLCAWSLVCLRLCHFCNIKDIADILYIVF